MEIGANFETLEKMYRFGGDHWWVWLIKIAAVTAVLGFLLFKSIERVPAGHVAIKLKFGDVKRYKYGAHKGQAVIKHAGLHWVTPTWHGWLKVSIMERTLKLEPQTRKVEVGSNYVEGALTFRCKYDPKDPERDPEDVVKLALSHEVIDARVLSMAQREFRRLIQRNLRNSTIERRMVANLVTLMAIYGLMSEKYEVTREWPTEATQLASAFKETGFQVNLPTGLLPLSNHKPALATANSS